MRLVQLLHGFFAKVDDEDFEIVSGYKWYVNNYGYAVAFVGKKAILMHRLILGINDPKIKVDHRRHDKLDNRRSEIRVATHSQNMRNRRPSGSSGFLGVTIIKKSVTGGCQINFKSQIQVDGVVKHLGTFDSEVDAALAYDNAAKKYHGEFANLNFR